MSYGKDIFQKDIRVSSKRAADIADTSNSSDGDTVYVYETKIPVTAHSPIGTVVLLTAVTLGKGLVRRARRLVRRQSRPGQPDTVRCFGRTLVRVTFLGDSNIAPTAEGFTATGVMNIPRICSSGVF